MDESQVAAAVGGALCPLCGVPLGSDRVLANGTPVCGNCAGNLQRELDAQVGTWSDLPLAAAGGLVGASIGAAIWAAIVIATNFEVGYVAVLVGFLTGMGVKVATGKRGNDLQLTAAVLAIVGLLIAKYLIFAWLMSQASATQGNPIAWYDPRLIPLFPRLIVQMSSPFDLLWIFIAVSAAYRVPAPSGVSLAKA